MNIEPMPRNISQFWEMCRNPSEFFNKPWWRFLLDDEKDLFWGCPGFSGDPYLESMARDWITIWRGT